MKLIDRQIAYPEPNKSCAAYENVYYLRATGPEMIRVRTLEIRNDIYDHCTVSHSSDHGRSWSEPEPYPVSWKVENGVERQGFGVPFVDPVNGRLVVITTRSFLPTDHMLEELTTAYPIYRVSEDGGRTWRVEERMVHRDSSRYTPEHPFDGFWVGKNAMHLANIPFRASNGTLIVPMQRTRLAPDGTLFCPPGALSFHDVLVLIGTWREDGGIDWESGPPVVNEPDRSTRGAIEAAVAEMPDGRMLMVLRGSNAGNLRLPGHKWFALSDDGGHTWSRPEPWGYTDGSLFYSPSSYSNILPHSNGKYYWFGNICPANPEGNRPRYPVVVGEIDPDSCRLIKESLTVIDTREEGEEPEPAMGNWDNYEGRDTGDVVMRMTRLWVAPGEVMRGPAYLYRLRP